LSIHRRSVPDQPPPCGVYATLANAIAQSKREIGIRMALGASPVGVAHLLSARPMLVTTLGVAAGAAAFYAVSPLFRNLLFGVSATNPFARPLLVSFPTRTGSVAERPRPSYPNHGVTGRKIFYIQNQKRFIWAPIAAERLGRPLIGLMCLAQPLGSGLTRVCGQRHWGTGAIPRRRGPEAAGVGYEEEMGRCEEGQ
jgi:hypothetical protein